MNKNTMNSKGGKFVGTMQKLAKLRSKSRSTTPLQVGNVLTKKALPKGTANYDSDIDTPEGQGSVNVSKGQAALNPKQQGVNKNGRK